MSELIFSTTQGGPTFDTHSKSVVNPDVTCTKEAKQHQKAIDKWLTKDPYFATHKDVKFGDMEWRAEPLANLQGDTNRQMCIGSPSEKKLK